MNALDGSIGRFRHRRHRSVAVSVMCVALAACTSPEADRTPRPAAASAIVVGVSGAFAENQIVAEMYAQVLEHAGYQVERQLDLRSRETSQSALEAGQIDVKPEYLSSLALFLDPDAEASPRPSTWLGSTPGCSVHEDHPARTVAGRGHEPVRRECGDGRAVRPDHDELAGPGRRSADARRASGMPRPAVLSPGLSRVYGLVFYDFMALDAGGPLTVDALRRDDVQVGLLFSTDPRIEVNGFVPLLDDRRLQDAENITPVIRSEKLNDEVRRLLDAVSARLTSAEMTDLVGLVVIDGQDVATVATGFLTENGLVRHP